MALINDRGDILEETRFETQDDYDIFLTNLKDSLQTLDLTKYKIQICCTAVPGLLDRKRGVVEALGNLPWKNEPIADDISKIIDGTRVIIENDSKLAGLAEAKTLKDADRTLYITISTGIGAALVVNGHLSTDVIDMEAGKMPLQHAGESVIWENFASGKAFAQKYGQRGEEVSDPMIWKNYAADVGSGLSVLCSIFQLDAIIFGGGFGQYAKSFIPHIRPIIDSLHPIIEKPKILTAAHYGEKSVIYGCYEYAKDYLPT